MSTVSRTAQAARAFGVMSGGIFLLWLLVVASVVVTLVVLAV